MPLKFYGNSGAFNASVLEYAINLSSIIPKLPELPKIDGNKFLAHHDDVVAGIQEGDYLLIIAGDQIDSRAVKLSEALLGKHLLRAWNLALVEVAVFEQVTDSGTKSHLLVPHIRGTIVPIRRQVVTIEIRGDKTRVEVSPATPAATEEGWNEDKYFAKVQGVAAPLRQFSEDLRRFPNEYPNVNLAFGRGKTPTLTLRKAGRGIVSLYLDSSGSLTFYKPSFSRAFGEDLGMLYEKRLEALFPEEMKKESAFIKLQTGTMQRDLDGVLAILKEILAKS
jgi:hypothetical protein